MIDKSGNVSNNSGCEKPTFSSYRKNCVVVIIKALTNNYFKIFRMQRAHPEEYNFTPQTWVLPAEYPFSFVYNDI